MSEQNDRTRGVTSRLKALLSRQFSTTDEKLLEDAASAIFALLDEELALLNAAREKETGKKRKYAAGKVPFGYEAVGDKLAPLDNGPELIAARVRLSSEGHSLRRISQLLAHEGIRISHTGVRRLRNSRA